MEFRLLGPLEAVGATGPLSLGGLKQRAVLALLLLRAGRVVSTDELIDAVWDGHGSERSLRSLQVYVSNLRRLLDEADGRTDRVRRQGPGYLLDAAADSVDVLEFERLAAEGRAALTGRNLDVGRTRLEEALALWRGPALADFAYQGWASREAERLDEQRLAVLEERIDADLQLGRSAEVVGELERLVAEHPYRERLRGQLMLALYRDGRQADALAVYQDTRTALVDELGIEPGPELRELERRILAQDPTLATHSGTGERALPSGTVTFLFTDVEGSTRLLHELGAEAYASALADHQRVIRDAVAAHGGVEVDSQGDAFLCAFASGRAAVTATATIQQHLTGPIRVRAGLHTGEALVRDGRYVGADVHRAARIAAAGHGGQTVLSAATAAMVDDAPLVDLGEHRLKDLSAPLRLYQLGGGEFPPLATLYRANLPVPATPFLGRQRDLAAVADCLERRDARVVTLTGPGGVGKTRLALQAAAAAVAAFPDGLVWIALASLRDPALVVSAVAQALGINEPAGGDVTGALESRLAGRRLLLLLDNVEHLLPAAAEPVAALAAVPGPTVLVTSRERLQVRGEHVLDVPPLDDEEAVTLFVARAAALGTPVDRSDTVLALCRALDDLPLALELAAARLRLFSPEQLLERLSQRLDLLKGERDADPRHKTLRATIGWSYELLPDDEQHLFARLAALPAGASYELAEAVCGADPDTCQSLVDKSLVRRRETTAGPRLWMLETVREFALDRLDELGERALVEKRLVDEMLAFATAAQFGWREEAMPWLQRFDADRDNVRRALRVALDHKDARRALEIATYLGWLFQARGLLREGIDWIGQARAAAGDLKDPRLEGYAELCFAVLSQEAGDADASENERSLRRAIDLLDRASDRYLRAFAVYTLANRIVQREPEEAERLLRGLHGEMRELGDPTMQAAAATSLAHAVMARGDADEGLSLLGEALELEVPNQSNRIVMEVSYGELLARLGRLDEARSVLDGAAESAGRIGLRRELAMAEGQRSLVRLLAGDVDGARSAAAVALEIAEQSHAFRSDALLAAAALRASDGDDGGAVLLWARARALAEQFDADNTEAQVEARYLEPLRDRLENLAFERAWRAGEASEQAPVTVFPGPTP